MVRCLLDFYLQQGIEMTHLYCGIVFNVKEWLKPYVDMNTELRNKCKKEGQAIGTIVYKQAHEQCHLWEVPPECDEAEQSTLKFVNTLLDAIKVQSLPGFVRNVYHNGNFTIADVKHEEVKFDKPIYLGATITELAKLHMYRFYYNHVVPHWGRDRVQLLMTDTDSLMLKVKKTKDIWADIKAFNREHMRTGWKMKATQGMGSWVC